MSAPLGCARTRISGRAAHIFYDHHVPSSEWTLRLRIPSWTSSAAVKVNGRLLEATPGAGNYFSIGRTWKKGDRVDLELPMRLEVKPFPDEPRMQASLYGPIVLAGDLGAQGLTEGLILDQQGAAVGKIPVNVPELHASARNWKTGSSGMILRR